VIAPGPQIREANPVEIGEGDRIARAVRRRNGVEPEGQRTMDDGGQNEGEEEELGAGSGCPALAFGGDDGIVRVAQDRLGCHRRRRMKGDDPPGLEVLVDEEKADDPAIEIEQGIPQASRPAQRQHGEQRHEHVIREAHQDVVEDLPPGAAECAADRKRHLEIGQIAERRAPHEFDGQNHDRDSAERTRAPSRAAADRAA
jgi:hypothetical protein